MDRRDDLQIARDVLFSTVVWCLCVFAAVNGAAADKSSAPPAVALPSGLGDAQTEQGFRIELVAGENLVTAPAAMAFDEDGRLFVVETRRSANRLSGRIRLLQDTNYDGVFDTSTVYADKLPWPSAISPYGGGVFVGATPSIFFLKDSKARGVADVRKLSFGIAATNSMKPAAQANSFNWALDNRMHGVTGFLDSEVPAAVAANVVGSDFSIDPRALKIFTANDAARSGLSFDNRGRAYVCDQAHPLLLEMYERRYTDRNPFFEIPDRAVSIINGPTVGPNPGDLTPPWLDRGNPFVVYRGGVFPTNCIGNIFIADASGQAIHRLICRPNGLEMSCTPNLTAADFAGSHDAAFRPVQIIAGPDGLLYVASRQMGDDSGRIYRIVPENYRSPGKPLLGKLKAPALVALLEQSDGWRRDTAARLLYERLDAAAPPLLAAMASNSKFPQARIQALCALDGFDRLNQEAVLRALRDPDENVRARGVLLCESIANNGGVSDIIWTQLRKMAADPSLRVRYQLAFTLGNIGGPGRVALLAAILRQNPDNVWIQTAVVSSLADGAGELFVLLANDAKYSATPIGQDFLRRLLIMIGTKGRVASLNRVLDYVDAMSADSLRAYSILRDVGEGLRRQNSSLALADPQGRMQRFYGEAFKIAASARAADEPRIAALKLLGVSPVTYGQTADLLLLLLGTGQSDAAQAAVVGTLGRFSDPRLARAVIQRWSALPQSVRQPAVAALLSRSERVPDVVAAIEQGIIAPGDLTQLQINYLRNYRDPAISARAVQLFGPLTWKRADAVKRFTPALKTTGSVEGGREVFKARCAVCHDKSGAGTGLGPDLRSVRHWGKQQILEAILQPGEEIQPEYATVEVETALGDTFIGVVAGGNDTTLTLRLVNGEIVILPRTNVKFVRPQPWSLMPDGLESGLTVQNMADLLEYVAQISR